MYYNLRLSLGCNLGKDLSKEVEMSQSVKLKDTRLYLQLYIPIENEDIMWQTYVSDVIKYEKKIRKQYLLHKVLTETTIVQLIIASQKKQLLTL